MKYKMFQHYRWGKPVLSFVAIIDASKKHSIPFRRQKTWRVPFDKERCQYNEKELKALFLRQAKRWQEQVMKSIFGDKVLELTQEEIFSNANESSSPTGATGTVERKGSNGN